MIGVTGKVGKFIVKEFLNRGYQLKLLLRFPEKFNLLIRVFRLLQAMRGIQ